MNPTPFMVLPFAVAGVSQYLDPTQVSPMFPSMYELGATEQWLFGADNPTMTGRNQGLQLQPNCVFTITAAGSGYGTTPPVVTLTSNDAGTGMTAVAFVTGGAVTDIQVVNPGSGYTVAPTVSMTGTATATAAMATAPTLGTGYMAIPNGYAQGPISPFLETDEFTMTCVEQLPATGVTHMAMGTGSNINPTGAGNTSLFRSSNAYSNNTTGFSPVAATLADPAGVTLGSSYVFLASAYDAGSRRIYVGGGAAPADSTAVARLKAARRLALGNAYYRAAFLIGGRVCEFTYWNRKLSAAEILAVYARAKVRQASRGIPVV